MRRKAPIDKGYIAVFVCFSTKAVHLELVSNLTTEALIAAIHRMASRRGIPAHIYSDNGTNFIGAKNELPRLLQQASDNQTEYICESLARDGIQWHFIPPSAPNFGGLWEAAVRSTKHHLKRITHNRKLTFEEFSTFLCRVEATLNSRPLCAYTDDDGNFDMLTPGHLLKGSPLNSIPEPDTTFIPENRLSRWQLVQTMHRHFWKRWANEYLSTLQKRSKWTEMRENIQPGMLVLIREENIPPNKWKLGKIETVHPGSDGVVRVATVKIGSKLFDRPVNKICPLPNDSDN